MNVQGLALMLTNVASALEWTFFDSLVNEGVHPDELRGTRQRANALAAAVRSTPHERLDELVAKFDPQLTRTMEKFQGEWQSKTLEGFRDAQVMLGHVNTIFNEAGIKT